MKHTRSEDLNGSDCMVYYLEKKSRQMLFYQEQVAKVEPIMKKDATDQTMAFFYVTSNGSVNVRKPGRLHCQNDTACWRQLFTAGCQRR